MNPKPLIRTLGTFGMSVLLTASAWALSANTMNLSTYNTDTLPEGMYAKMSTNKGDIILKLHYDKTPLTVCNFVGLAEGKVPNTAKQTGAPFYDGLKFHRVISNFMIQGGDPDGVGSGGPGYRFEDEFHPELTHSGPGILSMANSGPGTNGSQFFITHVATPWLDGMHSIFGAVVSGQDVVNAIQQGDSIESLTIIRKGTAAVSFDASAAAMDTYKAQMKDKEAKANQESAQEFDNWVMKTYPGAQKTASGLYYAVIQEGTGAQAAAGKTVAVHYSGKLTSGTEFDNSYRRGEPIEFKLGIGQVIQGWDEGIGLMQVGSKYTLIIPSDLGYGKRGAGGVIPPNSTLIFETELISVK